MSIDWNEQQDERFQLNNHKKEYLNIKEILRKQQIDILDEIKRAQDSEDYNALQIALAQMGRISSELKILNRRINTIDYTLSNR